MVKTVAFHNLGCKVNSYETEKMMKDLQAEGYVIVPFDEKADIYIINTCSVTNIADRKSRQMIHRARTMNPEALVVAAGCYVDTHADMDKEAEGVDICVANKDKRDIGDIINKYVKEHDASETDLKPLTHTRFFIKVQDGCDRFCSYCIIPYARGRIQSRPVREVLAEVRQGVIDGYKEFVPTGIHISSYGKDRPEDGEDLLTLIEGMASIEGVRRIRLSSLEPGLITKELTERMSRIDKLCPHFHLSLQSGSDTVLKRMNRRYTSEDYLRALDILRSYFDDPAITTDIITGFPGESDKEFQETLDLVERAGFYETHVFKYSRRKGTAADRMPGQLTDKVKHERSKTLLQINKIKKQTFEDRYISGNKTAEVLFEDMEDTGNKTLRAGYTREYIKVYDEGGIYNEGDIAKGTIIRQGPYILFTGNHGLTV